MTKQTTPPPDADPPPKLFGWLMEQQEHEDNADVRVALLVEASRLLQEYLRDDAPKDKEKTP